MTDVFAPAWALGTLAAAAVAASAIAAIRVLRGPTQADRVLALDIFLASAVALCVAAGLTFDETAFLDVGLVLALVGFVGTLGWARLIEAPRRQHTVHLTPDQAEKKASE